MHTNKSNKAPIKNGMKVPKPFIVLGHILQAISHKLATKYAIRLFITPFKFKTPKQEYQFYEGVRQELVLVPELNKKIMVYSIGNSKKKVLLVHGWSGRGTQLYKIANALVNNGYQVISFDAPAHGKSTGKTTMMTEFITSIFELEKKYGCFEFAIGHSLGGMSILNSVKQGLSVKKVVSVGAGDIITDIIVNFIKKLELKHIIVDKMKVLFYKKFNEDIDNYSASFAAKKVKTPTLVVHDTEDKEVNVSCAYNIRQSLKNGEMYITTGLGHTRILRDDTVVERIISFLVKNE
jgi:pimeloyl-ACP methyl ester carboxylesterase